MFPTVNQDMLKTAYDALVIATTNAQGAGLKYEQHKSALETTVLQAIAVGEIQGKNEGERKAAALAAFPALFEIQDKLEVEAKQAQFALELCKIKLNFIRDAIRLDELAITGVKALDKPVSETGNEMPTAKKPTCPE